MFQRVIRWCAASVLIASVGLGADTTKQQQTLDDILRILPRSAPWENWLKSSGELPPDFSKLPSNPFLPQISPTVPQKRPNNSSLYLHIGPTTRLACPANRIAR